MKTMMLANTIIMSVYAICVTCAAAYFNNPGILWWYLLLMLIGFTGKEKTTKTTKGEANDH